MNWDAHLRLRHVRCFLEIARAESVSVAADRLNITQPAVSRSLRELEDILGAQLFDRAGRGLRLNEAGRMFQSHAAASMTELMRGYDRLVKEGVRRSGFRWEPCRPHPQICFPGRPFDFARKLRMSGSTS
ncbi:LysR family transcriptional regulator [Sulfitobacter pacificus]|uniref:LysR family transcriptional regulator n=1 Tax=Sulfitobacter pacificus TaxID=1499314 RepID=UPI0036060BC2